jgi:Zn-dependent peptidase ImmA (M78 family)
LESLSKATLTPFGYFFLKEPPEERLPFSHFRTLEGEAVTRPSPNLIETVQAMQSRQAWMRDFLIDEGQEPLPFVRSARLEDTPESVASSMKEALRFSEGCAASESTWTDALRTLRESIASAGILVVVNGVVGNSTHRRLDTEEFRGFVLVDEYAPLMFVNGADCKAAQMFTLAHELAHVFYGSSAAFDLRQMEPAKDRTEKVCDQVAAEFLVPEREMTQLWPSIQSLSNPYQRIARQFKVSEIVVARRALDLKLIRKSAFLEFYHWYLKEQCLRQERRKKSDKPQGADFHRTQNLRIGKRFASAVLQAVSEGRLLYSEAYRLTGLYGKTFDGYADYLAGEGAL